MENKKRVKNLFFVMFILLVVLIAYYFLCIYFPKYTIKCFFNEITGLNCPGCGITRMLSSFIQFKFIQGIKFNYFLALTLPIVGGILIYSCYLYVKGKKSGKVFNIICYIYLFMLLSWWIVRNIIGV